MSLNRDQILAHKTLKCETIEVPEWGGEVKVRELSASEADVFESGLAAARQGQNGSGPDPLIARNFRAKIVALAAVDDEGNRLFTDDDVETLGSMSRSALDRVSSVAMRLSGYSDDGKKNSPTAADSPIVSH